MSSIVDRIHEDEDELDRLRAQVAALREDAIRTQNEIVMPLRAQVAALEAERDALREDAERYRWLRDVSVPPHNFYISVPVEFHDVKYTSAEVDAAIDAARSKP